ncbi:MAG TPA: OmpA family protein [Planctomycetota bacterium]|jgi:flagellar motor protein MotB
MGRYRIAVLGLLAAGVMVSLMGCGGREKVAIAAKDDTIKRQEDLIAKERDDKGKLSEMNDQLAKQNQDMADKNATLAAQNAKETAALRQQVADLEGIMKDIGAKMNQGRTVAEGNDASLSRDKDNCIHITVASQTFFDSGKADLKTTAHSMLQNICKTIKARYPNNYIRVEGHTDATPVVHNKAKYPDNMSLSIARSRAVYDFMIKQGGITASKMYTAGYGEFQPLVHPEKTAADRAKNRRVEIVIMPNTIKVQKEQLAEMKPAPASSTRKK